MKQKFMHLGLLCLMAVSLTACASDPASGSAGTETPTVESLTSVTFTLENRTLQDGMLSISNGIEGDGKRYGAANVDGEIIVPISSMVPLFFNDGLARFVGETDAENQINFVDTTGKTVISEVYGQSKLSTDTFIDGYIVIFSKVTTGVYKGTSQGTYVIDKSGAILLDSSDSTISYFNLGDGLFARFDNTDASFPSGEYLDIVDIDGATVYNGELMAYDVKNEFNGIYSDYNNNYGIIDNKSFEYVTEPNFYYITPFEKGLSLSALTDGTVQIMDAKGKQLVNLSEKYGTDETTSYRAIFTEDVLAVNFNNGRTSILLDSKGEVISETEYDRIILSANGIGVCEKDGKFGYIDAKGNELLPPTYDFATNIENGIGIVQDGEIIYKFEM